MSDDRTVRGSEAEAVEAGAKRAPRGGAKGPRVRIQRDLADIPAVKDETGEKVAQLFEGFLEQCVPPLPRICLPPYDACAVLTRSLQVLGR